MPDRTTLKVGDEIRLLRVPKGDADQRDREVKQNIEQPGWTATIIELIIAQQPIVKIDSIDDYGQPWFTVTILVNEQVEEHSLTIMDNTSWVLFREGF